MILPETLPLSVIPNAGQVDSRALYHTRSNGCQCYFTADGVTLVFAMGPTDGLALRLSFVGSRPRIEPEPHLEAPGKANFLLGNDPQRWLSNLPTYNELLYRDVWPGIDLIFRGQGGELKYDLVVSPGARVEDIRLAWRGASHVTVGETGQLLIQTPVGVLSEAIPQSYQEIAGSRVPIHARFVLRKQTDEGTAEYGFALEGSHDAQYPLVIDPSILYSTYLGGSGFDEPHSIDVDAAGNAYVTGVTASANFPVTPGSFQTASGGGSDAFITKIDPTGSVLIYSTYLGGMGTDEADDIAVDAAGVAYVTGRTNSTDFPTTAGAFQTALAGQFDAFVTKLNATGNALPYSTYLGGLSFSNGSGIAVDAAGDIYVTGATLSDNFPTTPGAFQTVRAGMNDWFVAKISPDGAGSADLIYGTYLGGTEADFANSIAVDTAGNAYVVGVTNSSSFPVTVGAAQTVFGGTSDAAVVKLNATGTGLIYATFLGGSGADGGNGIAIDSAGTATVTGGTNSPNFPTTAGAFQTAPSGNGDGFVARLNAAGSALLYATYLGGSLSDFPLEVAVDSAGNAYVTGRTASADFPTTPGAFSTVLNGPTDAFVTQLNSTGTGLLFSTYLGGNGSEEGTAIAVDGAGDVYVTGETNSMDFPVTPGVVQPAFGGGIQDGFVVKMSLTPAPPPRGVAWQMVEVQTDTDQ